MASNDLKWAKNDPKWPIKKDSEFLPNSAIESQKTQKLGVFAEILPPLEALLETNPLQEGNKQTITFSGNQSLGTFLTTR